MSNFFSCLWAEMIKEHRNTFYNKVIYFSLLVWPMFGFITSYYSFKPFDLGVQSPLNRFVDSEQLLLFLLMGYLGYIFFWCLVQSAWFLSFERQSGTLEIIFLSPVNRLTFVFGRSLSALVEGAWLFFLFVVLAMFMVDGIEMAGWWSAPLALVVLTLSAAAWGAFLNVVFVFSRDAGFLYTVLDEPMLIFAGVKIPPFALPFWGKLIALVFPLTYALDIVRRLLMEGATIGEIAPQLVLLLLIISVLVLLSGVLIRRVERRLRQTGNMVLF